MLDTRTLALEILRDSYLATRISATTANGFCNPHRASLSQLILANSIELASIAGAVVH